jgi:hypothetical protein
MLISAMYLLMTIREAWLMKHQNLKRTLFQLHRKCRILEFTRTRKLITRLELRRIYLNRKRILLGLHQMRTTREQYLLCGSQHG